MNRAELQALMEIVKKLDWNDMPVCECVERVTQMVKNQQALVLDCVGECDDFEETLLSMAIWDKNKILSTQFVNDYWSLVDFEYKLFLEDMGITDSDYKAMLDYYVNISGEARVAEEEEDLEYYCHCLDLCDDYASREY
jgi:hypothetical protein